MSSSFVSAARNAPLAATLALGGVLACSSPSPVPTSTETLCSPDLTLTYENFGKPFMEKYCTRCHASDLHGADRHGASLYHDFDYELGILYVWEHVDQQAAAGPASVNELMPPDGLKPSLEERTQLGEWLACEQYNYNAIYDAGVGDAQGALDAGPTADAQP